MEVPTLFSGLALRRRKTAVLSVKASNAMAGLLDGVVRDGDRGDSSDEEELWLALGVCVLEGRSGREDGGWWRLASGWGGGEGVYRKGSLFGGSSARGRRRGFALVEELRSPTVKQSQASCFPCVFFGCIIKIKYSSLN